MIICVRAFKIFRQLHMQARNQRIRFAFDLSLWRLIDNFLLSLFSCISLSESLSWQRNLSFSCVETHTFPVFFNATSFLQLPGRANHNTISVSFQFRTWNPDGLLLFSNLDDGTLEISLEESKVVVHINVTRTTSNNRVDLSSGEFNCEAVSFGIICIYPLQLWWTLKTIGP